MNSPWDADEERFINRIKRTPSQRQMDDIRQRCEDELKHAMRSYIGKQNTTLNQRTIEYLTKQVITKYNNELTERGFDAEISYQLTPQGTW